MEPVEHAVTVGDVCEPVSAVGPQTRCEEVANLFVRQEDLFALPVVDDQGVPVGLLNRFRLLERLAQRFGRDLFLRRPIGDFLDGPALVLDEHTQIEDAGSLVFEGDRPHILDGFVVTREGRYLGIGTGVTLTRALTDLTLTRARIASEKAARENAAKSDFIARVSHEIRTPLNGVLGIAALLGDTSLSIEQRELVDLLRVSGDALMALVDDVLDYSKIEASKFEIAHVEFNLRTLMADVAKILAVKANSKGLSVTSAIAADVPDTVIGDPARLRQVLLNLGGNAVKFTKHGSVAFRVRVLEIGVDYTRLETRVEDTGIGVPPDRLDQLFRPFYQVGGPNSQQYGGTGLGLAISREIVQRMGGDITVESEVGRGSVFTFTATLTTPAPANVAGTSLSSPTAVSGGALAVLRGEGSRVPLRVLLAEDNTINQLVAARLLEKLWCTVRVVSDGAEAVGALASETFDLVLMDCNMPGVDGYEATRRIRQGNAGLAARSIPVVALTASATTDNHAACANAGMNGFLSKPLTPASLSGELDKWRRVNECTE